MLIPEVMRGMPNWTVKVTVTEEMATLIGFRNDTKYKRYILTDDQGNTIPTVMYGHEIPPISKALRLHGVYTISNAQVKEPIGPHGFPLNWVLQRNTVISNLRDEQPNLQHFLGNIIPLDMLIEHLPKNAGTEKEDVIVGKHI